MGNPDFGLILGGEMKLAKSVYLDARYSSGFLSLDPDGDADVKNGVIQLIAGFRF